MSAQAADTAPAGLDRARIADILDRDPADLDPAQARAWLDALEREDARNREALIAGLTGTTAAIHLVLGGKLFVLNGVGFLALLAARHLLPKSEAWQGYARDGLLGYTGLTIGGYFAQQGIGGFSSIVGLGTKMLELALIRVLWADRTAARARLERVVAAAEAGGR